MCFCERCRQTSFCCSHNLSSEQQTGNQTDSSIHNAVDVLLKKTLHTSSSWNTRIGLQHLRALWECVKMERPPAWITALREEQHVWVTVSFINTASYLSWYVVSGCLDTFWHQTNNWKIPELGRACVCVCVWYFERFGGPAESGSGQRTSLEKGGNFFGGAIICFLSSPPPPHLSFHSEGEKTFSFMLQRWSNRRRRLSGVRAERFWHYATSTLHNAPDCFAADLQAPRRNSSTIPVATFQTNTLLHALTWWLTMRAWCRQLSPEKALRHMLKKWAGETNSEKAPHIKVLKQTDCPPWAMLTKFTHTWMNHPSSSYWRLDTALTWVLLIWLC